MKTQALPARPADRRLYFAGLVWLGVAILYTFLLPQLPQRAADYNFDLYYVSGVAAIRGLDPAITDIAPLGRSLGCHMPQKYFANSTPFFRIIFDGRSSQSFDCLPAVGRYRSHGFRWRNCNVDAHGPYEHTDGCAGTWAASALSARD